MAEKWIQKAIKKPGALRSALGAKKGEPIHAKKLAAAAKKTLIAMLSKQMEVLELRVFLEHT